MGITRNATGNPLYNNGKMFIAEDTSFIAGDSPAAHNVTGTLTPTSSTKNIMGNRGYIAVDGAGNITVELSKTADGSAYENSFTLKSGEIFDLTGLEIGYIRLTHSGTDSAYRINVW